MFSEEIQPYVESSPNMMREKQVVMQNRVQGTQYRVIDHEREGEEQNHICGVVVFDTEYNTTYLSCYGVFRTRAWRHIIVERKPWQPETVLFLTSSNLLGCMLYILTKLSMSLKKEYQRDERSSVYNTFSIFSISSLLKCYALYATSNKKG